MMYDVIFKNGNVVDVKNEQILQADIAVKDGKIAGIGHFSGENVIDCTGKYITLDSLMHMYILNLVWRHQWNFPKQLCRMVQRRLSQIPMNLSMSKEMKRWNTFWMQQAMPHLESMS